MCLDIIILIINIFSPNPPDCPMLNAGVGAIASSRDTSFDSVVTYTCPVGQEFANNKTSIVTKCMPGGAWSIDYIPDCQGE